jgi:hypothetical protein
VTQLNRFPTYGENLADKGITSRTWYGYFSGLFRGQPTGLPSSITVGPSPFNYSAPSGGTVLIQGGTVSLVQISRDGVSNYTTGQTQGAIPVSFQDTLIITYSVAPTMTFVPR